MTVRAMGVLLASLWAAPVVAQATPVDTLRAYLECYLHETRVLEAGWNIRVVLGDTFEEDGVAFYAATEADPSYMQAIMYVDTLAFAGLPDAERRRVLVHEVAHIWLWELAEALWAKDKRFAERIEERTVSLIDRWPLWLTRCYAR